MQNLSGTAENWGGRRQPVAERKQQGREPDRAPLPQANTERVTKLIEIAIAAAREEYGKRADKEMYDAIISLEGAANSLSDS